MDNDELAYWGEHGRNASEQTVLLNGVNSAGDIIKLWNLFGELELRINANHAEATP